PRAARRKGAALRTAGRGRTVRGAVDRRLRGGRADVKRRHRMERRQFIESAVVAAGAAALSPWSALAADPAMIGIQVGAVSFVVPAVYAVVPRTPARRRSAPAEHTPPGSRKAGVRPHPPRRALRPAAPAVLQGRDDRAGEAPQPPRQKLHNRKRPRLTPILCP